jgi:hypothetical protein
VFGRETSWRVPVLLEKYIQATDFSTSNNAFLMCMPSFSGKHMQMITPIIDFMSWILTGFLNLSWKQTMLDIR